MIKVDVTKVHILGRGVWGISLVQLKRTQFFRSNILNVIYLHGNVHYSTNILKIYCESKATERSEPKWCYIKVLGAKRPLQISLSILPYVLFRLLDRWASIAPRSNFCRKMKRTFYEYTFHFHVLVVIVKTIKCIEKSPIKYSFINTISISKSRINMYITYIYIIYNTNI